MRTVTAGSSFGSQVSSTLHVGVGNATVLDSVQVTWPGGTVQVFINVPVDRRHDILEGASLTAFGEGATEAVPERFEVRSYPNPFNPSTSIVVRLPRPMQLRVRVVDLLGRVVADLADVHAEAGERRFTFDASRLSSGLYFAWVSADQQTVLTKLLLAR